MTFTTVIERLNALVELKVQYTAINNSVSSNSGLRFNLAFSHCSTSIYYAGEILMMGKLNFHGYLILQFCCSLL